MNFDRAEYQHIPTSIINAALPLKASVGCEYDSTGKRVAFFLVVSPTWKVYRGTVSGMLALLRQVKKDQQK